MKRESRLIDKSNFDDPEDIVLAGSIEEYDMLMEWDRSELVGLIQDLDASLSEANEQVQKLKVLHKGTKVQG